MKSPLKFCPLIKEECQTTCVFYRPTGYCWLADLVFKYAQKAPPEVLVSEHIDLVTNVLDDLHKTITPAVNFLLLDPETWTEEEKATKSEEPIFPPGTQEALFRDPPGQKSE